MVDARPSPNVKVKALRRSSPDKSVECIDDSCDDGHVQVTVERHPGPSIGRRLAELQQQWITAAGYDKQGLESGPRDLDRLAAALSTAEQLVIIGDDADTYGYGRLISWTETDSTRVHLLDVHAAPGSKRAQVETRLFTTLEAVCRNPADPTQAVLGANADSDDTIRIAILDTLDFCLHFEMVELELAGRSLIGPLPPGVGVRTGRPSDAAAIAKLTATNWQGRPHFSGLPVDRVAGWLERNDPELFLLAEDAGELVGIAVADIGDRVVKIEDLGVHPTWRRQGLGLGLMTELLNRIEQRSTLPVRLLTEGDDPSGALRLYERLGFTTVVRHGRYRKSLNP